MHKLAASVVRVWLMAVCHRNNLQLLTPAAILASMAGRSTIEKEDIDEMGELFLDAKTSAAQFDSPKQYW